MTDNASRQMQTTSPWPAWSWLGVGMRLPVDWEMLRFSRNPETGHCIFADRYQYRLELNWKRVPEPPDMERMINDYQAKLADQGMKNLRRTGHSPWQGITGLDGDCEISRYGRYLPENNLILEAVFLWPPAEKAKPASEGRVLDSIRAETTAADGTRQWQAFDMVWKAPEKWLFQDCEASATQTGMTFEASNGRDKATFARHAMVSQWLTTSVSEWLEDNMPAAYRKKSLRCTIQAGHEVANLVAEREQSVWPDWRHGRRMYQACAWVCPQKQRLFCLTRLNHQKKRDTLSETAVALSCCPSLEVKL